MTLKIKNILVVSTDWRNGEIYSFKQPKFFPHEPNRPIICNEQYIWQLNSNHRNRITRIIAQIKAIIEHAAQNHDTSADTFTRAITDEFSFYTAYTPLSIDEFKNIIQEISNELQKLNNDICKKLLFTFSSFPVLWPDNTLRNAIIHAQGAKNINGKPIIHYFSKASCSSIDCYYNNNLTQLAYPVLGDTDPQDVNRVMSNLITNHILAQFNGPTQHYSALLLQDHTGNQPWIEAIDICLDHTIGVAKNNALNLLKKQIADAPIIPVHINHIISSNYVMPSEHELTASFVHAVPQHRYELQGEKPYINFTFPITQSFFGVQRIAYHYQPIPIKLMYTDLLALAGSRINLASSRNAEGNSFLCELFESEKMQQPSNKFEKRLNSLLPYFDHNNINFKFNNKTALQLALERRLMPPKTFENFIHKGALIYPEVLQELVQNHQNLLSDLITFLCDNPLIYANHHASYGNNFYQDLLKKLGITANNSLKLLEREINQNSQINIDLLIELIPKLNDIEKRQFIQKYQWSLFTLATNNPELYKILINDFLQIPEISTKDQPQIIINFILNSNFFNDNQSLPLKELGNKLMQEAYAKAEKDLEKQKIQELAQLAESPNTDLESLKKIIDLNPNFYINIIKQQHQSLIAGVLQLELNLPINSQNKDLIFSIWNSHPNLLKYDHDFCLEYINTNAVSDNTSAAFADYIKRKQDFSDDDKIFLLNYQAKLSPNKRDREIITKCFGQDGVLLINIKQQLLTQFNPTELQTTIENSPEQILSDNYPKLRDLIKPTTPKLLSIIAHKECEKNTDEAHAYLLRALMANLDITAQTSLDHEVIIAVFNLCQTKSNSINRFLDSLSILIPVILSNIESKNLIQLIRALENKGFYALIARILNETLNHSSHTQDIINNITSTTLQDQEFYNVLTKNDNLLKLLNHRAINCDANEWIKRILLDKPDSLNLPNYEEFYKALSLYRENDSVLDFILQNKKAESIDYTALQSEFMQSILPKFQGRQSLSISFLPILFAISRKIDDLNSCATSKANPNIKDDIVELKNHIINYIAQDITEDTLKEKLKLLPENDNIKNSINNITKKCAQTGAIILSIIVSLSLIGLFVGLKQYHASKGQQFLFWKKNTTKSDISNIIDTVKCIGH